MRCGMVPHFANPLADFKKLAAIDAEAESLNEERYVTNSLQARTLLDTEGTG
jgi:hypothetical protein